MTGLLDQVHRMLVAAAVRNEGHPGAARLGAAADQLHEPLRVAVAGRVKAGKSTLVNAMVGELVAPTDARECTRIVTWYRDGVTYRVEGVATDGTRAPLRYDRDGDGLHIDLGGRPAASISHIDVTFPSADLRQMTLVDTPGLGSLDGAAHLRTTGFLTGEERPAPTDAVLYLLRHVHRDDLAFLEAFHDDEVAAANPVNAVGVLSRADEIGVARPDALRSAARIAARWREDRRLAALVQTVVPVAGLLAEAARTLRHDEFRAFRDLAAAEEWRVDEALVSVDRFASSTSDVGVTAPERARLLERFGLFGCRRAIAELRAQPHAGPGTLAQWLLEASGVPALRAVVAERFGRRAELLRSRQALLLARRVALELGDRDLLGEVERLVDGNHEMAELRVFNALSRGELPFSGDRASSAHRLLGGAGLDLHHRAGVDPGASTDEVRAALVDQHAAWQAQAAHPLATHEVAAAAAVLVRTCEGLLSATTAPVGARPASGRVTSPAPRDPERSTPWPETN